MEHLPLDLCMFTVQNQCINKGHHFHCSGAIFLFFLNYFSCWEFSALELREDLQSSV